MNIKLRAALEVTGLIALGVAVVAGVQFGLRSLVLAYGAEAVINGIAFGLVAVTAYVCVSLLYYIRVAKLQYKAKLDSMVDSK